MSDNTGKGAGCDDGPSSFQLLLTVPEVADCLRVSVRTVRNWIAWERLPAMKVGRVIRIRRDVVDKLIAEAKSTSQREERR